MGLHITKPFQTFTENGFPKELIEELERRCGRKVIGNKSASGTEILEEYAEQEITAGDMIVYTSADSVLQICGNEETMGLDNLYRYCEITRELTMRDEGIKIIKGKSKHNKKRFPIPGAFLQHVFGDLIPLIC